MFNIQFLENAGMLPEHARGDANNRGHPSSLGPPADGSEKVIVAQQEQAAEPGLQRASFEPPASNERAQSLPAPRAADGNFPGSPESALPPMYQNQIRIVENSMM